MRIPGIPGASDPAFRTRDRRWVSLDTLVLDTCGRMAKMGKDVGPVAAKAAIQVARQVVQEQEGLEGDALVAEVSMRLRQRRVLLTPRHVALVLRTYGEVVMDEEIAEVHELGV